MRSQSGPRLTRVGLPWVLREPRLRAVLLVSLLAGTAEGMIIPFLTLIAAERGISLAVIGAMAATFQVTQLVLQVPLGMLSDRLGRAWLVTAGLVLLAVASIGFGVAETTTAFLVLRVVQGAAVAAFLPSLRALIADVSPVERRGEAFAGFNAAFFGGIFGGPLLGGWLIGAFGYETLFAVAGVSATIIGVLTLILFPEFRRPIIDATVTVGEQIERVRIPMRALVTPALLGAFILGAAAQVPGGLSTAIWALYISDRGGSDLIVGLSYSAFAIPLLLLVGAGGRFAGKLPRWRSLLITYVALGVIVAAYGLTGSIPLLLLFGVMEGAAAALAMPTLDAYLTTVADRRIMGRVQGAFATAGTLGAAAVGYLSAVLYERSLALPFVVSGVLVIIATIPAVIIIRNVERQGLVLTPAVFEEDALATGVEPDQRASSGQ